MGGIPQKDPYRGTGLDPTSKQLALILQAAKTPCLQKGVQLVEQIFIFCLAMSC